MLTVGSLFAGIGGFDLGFERAGMRTLWQVEQSEFCRGVLERHFPNAQRFEDVRHVTGCIRRWEQEGGTLLEYVDVLCGGFPCQDISTAGTGAGLEGERSGLWSEYARLIRELRPRYVVVENVAALLGRGLGTVVGDLAACGYDAEWDCIPASAVGAPHQRDRLWLVAYAAGDRCRSRRTGRPSSGGAGEREPQRALQDSDADGQGRSLLAEHDSRTLLVGRGAPWRHPDGLRDEVANSDRGGRNGRPGQQRTRWRGEPADGGGEQAGTGPTDWWATEPDVGRVANGIPARVDRLKALGNALIPEIPYRIGRRIIEWEEGEVAA